MLSFLLGFETFTSTDPKHGKPKLEISKVNYSTNIRTE